MATSGPITYLVMADQFPSVAAPRERLPQSTGMSRPLIGYLVSTRETSCADGDARERPVFPARSAGLPWVSSARIMGPGRCHDLGTTFWLLCHLGVSGGIRQAEWAGPVSLRVPAARARQPP